MGYGTCKQGHDMCHHCGYGYSWIGVWKSPSLANGTWELVREARDDSWPRNVYFRVHTVYNKRTKLYVLWVNLNGGKADYAVGTSSVPEGPFKFTNYANGAVKGAGDFDILIDDDADASAYIIYTGTRTGHTMSVEKLSGSYLTSLAAPKPAPPAPIRPIAGFATVGQGACRDEHSLEPPFFTDETEPIERNFSRPECAAACIADTLCTGFSFCDGSGGGASCRGACHLYTPAGSKGPSGWRYTNGQAGDPHKIAKSTSDKWWSCFTKKVAAETGRKKVALAGPVKSNVSSGIIGMGFVEAPAIFKRKGVYYALFGNCCCFCGQGSGIGVHTASHPLGPWKYHDNIGCKKGFKTSDKCGCGMNHGSCKNIYGNSLTMAQQNFVMPVKTTTGTEYIWTGDRWQSGGCPDPSKKGTPACKPNAGIKYMDLQYWSPLLFVVDPASGLELPQQLQWLDSFVMDAIDVV